MRVSTVSPVTGSSTPMLGSADTLQEWGYLALEGGEGGVSMSYHRTNKFSSDEPRCCPRAPFYHFAIPLKPATGHLFDGGRHYAKLDMTIGAMRIRDCEEPWSVELREPIEGAELWMSKTSIDQISYEERTPVFPYSADLAKKPVFDSVMLHLVQALLPAVRRPVEADVLFVSSMLLAAKLHAVKSYSGVLMPPGRQASLSRRQEVRACELIRETLASDLSIEELSHACGLSAAHFARAFKHTTGLAPHQWRMRCRVTKAQDMLRSRINGLSEIASACGFADQSHLTKVFAKVAGSTPGAWRREFVI